MLSSPSGTVYVFLASPRNRERAARQQELQLRCFVARGLNPSASTVVGIGTEQYSPDGFSLDIAVHHQPNWTPEHDIALSGIQNELEVLCPSAIFEAQLR